MLRINWSEMDKALVLLTLEPDTVAEVLEEIMKIEGVIEARFLYGPYDGYAMIEAHNSGDLQTIVIDTIRQIEGIRSTMTCFVAD
jgi:DNA-binding Lrp family transcriptional regulator